MLVSLLLGMQSTISQSPPGMCKIYKKIIIKKKIKINLTILHKPHKMTQNLHNNYNQFQIYLIILQDSLKINQIAILNSLKMIKKFHQRIYRKY